MRDVSVGGPGAAGSLRPDLLTASLLLALACGAGTGTDERGQTDSRVIALVGVHVIRMDREVVLRDRTVVIRDGRIAKIGPMGRTEVPPEALRPGVRGRYVIPGLIDMHVHLTRGDLSTYLMAGVTTVRNMWGWSGIEEIRRDVASGAARGPRVFSAGPAVDGDPPVRSGAEVVTDPAAIPLLVQRQKAAGWDFVKVYQQVDPQVFSALVREAPVFGLRLIGHVPTKVSFHDALTGLASIEHLEGYDKALTGSRRPGFQSWLTIGPGVTPEMSALAEVTAARGVWNCPTLVVAARALGSGLAAGERDRAVQARRAMVRALRDAGALLLAGTDGGVPLVPAGQLAEELIELTRAGLTPYQALRAATIDAAAFLAASDSLGRVAEGMTDDLVVLADDPLRDVAAVRAPVAVVARGEWRRR